MKCQDCRVVISAMLDGEETAAEATAAEDHLAQCPACRATAAQMTDVTRMMRIRVAEPPPPDFAEVLLARLDNAEHGHDQPDSTPPPATPTSLDCAAQRTGLHVVGPAGCGCSPSCHCGCQQGQPCRCDARIA
jgi:anti-sigma factor RsiW